MKSHVIVILTSVLISGKFINGVPISVAESEDQNAEERDALSHQDTSISESLSKDNSETIDRDDDDRDATPYSSVEADVESLLKADEESLRTDEDLELRADLINESSSDERTGNTDETEERVADDKNDYEKSGTDLEREDKTDDKVDKIDESRLDATQENRKSLDDSAIIDAKGRSDDDSVERTESKNSRRSYNFGHFHNIHQYDTPPEIRNPYYPPTPSPMLLKKYLNRRNGQHYIQNPISAENSQELKEIDRFNAMKKSSNAYPYSPPVQKNYYVPQPPPQHLSILGGSPDSRQASQAYPNFYQHPPQYNTFSLLRI